MGRPEIQELPAKQVIEVQAFLRQREALDAWKKKHAKALVELAAIMVAYNPCLNAADKAVREKRVTCGPFVLKHFSRDRDAKVLRRVLGDAEFLKRGGTITPVELVAMDNERFDAVVATNADAEAKAVTYGPVYDKPKPISLP